MSYYVSAGLLLVGIFVGMLLCLLVGQRFGQRDHSQLTDVARARLTAVEAAIFGLMGLMIAFTFSGASDRYELRRQLTVDEANAIGSAYSYLDLLPVSSRQASLREKYRRYLEIRIDVWRVLPDVDASIAKAAAATKLQQEIWAETIAVLAEAPPHITLVMIPALDKMMDITTTSSIAAVTHTPKVIMAMLILLGFVCSLLAGYAIADSQSRQVRIYLLAFAFMMTATIYVIFDLDYPRFGLIRIDFADQALLDVLSSMK